MHLMNGQECETLKFNNFVLFNKMTQWGMFLRCFSSGENGGLRGKN